MGQPGEDRPDWPPLAVDVPDDLRELSADVAAYHREQRQLRRRAFLDRLVPMRRWRRWGVAGPVGVGFLIVVAAVGSLLALLVPSAPSHPLPGPLADPTARPGTVGGLLPDADIVDTTPGGKAVSARSYRPAVFLFLPAGCECTAAVARIAGETDSYRLSLILVTATASERSALTHLAVVPGHGGVAAAYDGTGALTSPYLPVEATEPTAVLVHADGVVDAIIPGITGETRLRLSTLAQPGASTSG